MSHDLALRLVPVACSSLLAAALVALAQADGGFGLTSRMVVAVAAWALLIPAVGLGFARIPNRLAVACCGLLAAFAAWSLASTQWAASAERAFIEFDRVAMYLGVLVISVTVISRTGRAVAADGLLLALTATAVIALVTRFFPHVLGGHETPLPSARARLSYPVGYWNALGILVSFAAPLALRVATVGRTAVVRAAAVAVFPLVAAVVYLASSRGAAITLAVAVATFLGLTERRWRAFGVLVSGATGAAAALAFLVQRHTLVDGPLESAAAIHQGRTMAVLLVACMAVSGLLLAVGERLFGHRRAPRPAVGAVLVGAAALAVLTVAIASHPVARFQAFKRPVPTTQTGASTNAHLLSGNGSGRWQFWGSAVDEFRTAPVAGRGAGSFSAWWSEHASFTYFVQNAHSLYLEALGELGLVGFLLLVGSFAAGLAGCVAAARRGEGGEQRVTVAACTGVFAAFAAGAAIDWVWQLAVVGVVAFVALGAALAGPGPARRSGGIGAGAALVAVAWVIVCLEAVPWLTAGRIADSQAAVRRGDVAGARHDALAAKSLESWAASPYVQLALVAESQGSFDEARHSIQQATQRDSKDWRIWYLAARIEREAGHAALARRSYAKARSLNPRSPLFAARRRPPSR